MAFSFKKLIPGKKKDAQQVPGKLRPSSPVKDIKQSKNKKEGKKKLKISGGSGAKYALVVGDEGAILLYIVGKAVQSRNFIANASVDNLKEFEAILSKNKKAPVYLVIDSMDQSFVQQSLPPISSLGVNKLIQRRLDRDLGADVVKGYVLLERDDGGRRDWNFLMVALENSPHLNIWYDFLENVNNRLKGIYLLSVEAEHVVKSLDAAMGIVHDKKHPGSKWKFFVTHNKVGGFRQVILKDGKIIFTRLTQPVGEMTPEVIAGNIEQEMAGTVEYMKRFSFSQQQGLDIYVIASADINNSLDISKVTANNIYKFTPFEVSEFLGISGAAQVSDQFGDVILTAFIACSKKHRLVMNVPNSKKVNSIYNLMQYERALSGIAILGMVGYGGVVGLGVLQKYSEIENLTQKKTAQQRRFDDLNSEIKKSGIDVKKINDTVVLYKKIGAEAQSPVSAISRIRPALPQQVAVREINWQQGGDASGGHPPVNSKFDSMTVLLRFPEIVNSEEAFNIAAKKVLADMRQAMPEYKVVFSKLPDAFNKKAEGGDISFDDTQASNKTIDNAALEAVLSLTRISEDQPRPAEGSAPAAASPEQAGAPHVSGLIRNSDIRDPKSFILSNPDGTRIPATGGGK